MTNEIEVGDTVVCRDAAFSKYPRLPRELQGKKLSVINLYKDPATGTPIRAGVTCPGIDNPRSKYNCFNIGCNYLTKKADKPAPALKEPTPWASRRYVDEQVENAVKAADTHYIILYAGAGVRQIIPVTVSYYIPQGSMYKVISITSGEYYVKRKLLFDTEADARNYLIVESGD